MLALAAVVALGLVAAGLLAWDLHRLATRADARKAAQVVATDSIETILSYDHATYDEGVTAAESLMTEGFAAEYTDTVDTVRAEVLETESVVKAQVVASSVVAAGSDEVEVLLFVNQTTTGTQVAQPRVDLNRVEVTLVRDDGSWLVSDIEAL
jgi:Mce-associated membrane protein